MTGASISCTTNAIKTRLTAPGYTINSSCIQRPSTVAFTNIRSCTTTVITSSEMAKFESVELDEIMFKITSCKPVHIYRKSFDSPLCTNTVPVQRILRTRNHPHKSVYICLESTQIQGCMYIPQVQYSFLKTIETIFFLHFK